MPEAVSTSGDWNRRILGSLEDNDIPPQVPNAFTLCLLTQFKVDNTCSKI